MNRVRWRGQGRPGEGGIYYLEWSFSCPKSLRAWRAGKGGEGPPGRGGGVMVDTVDIEGLVSFAAERLRPRVHPRCSLRGPTCDGKNARMADPRNSPVLTSVVGGRVLAGGERSSVSGAEQGRPDKSRAGLHSRRPGCAQHKEHRFLSWRARV